ncbi:hypothetical protein PHMEG_00027087, partial [Phytophthora megakarya]
ANALYVVGRFHAPRSNIHSAVSSEEALACCGPPRRKECELNDVSTSADRDTRSRRRLTRAWMPMKGDAYVRLVVDDVEADD